MLDSLLAKLTHVKRSGDGWSARCPAHEDRRSSLSIGTGDDGRVLLCCHAGCSLDAICSAVGVEPVDLFPDRSTVSTVNGNRAKRPKHGRNTNTVEANTVEKRRTDRPRGPKFATKREALAELERRHGRSSRHWVYHSATGQEVGLIVRWDTDTGKDIRPAALIDDDWRLCGMPEPRPLYDLPEVLDADTVYVTEGEKAADAIRSLGCVATTSAHGSQSPDKTDWAPLAGKRVVILPDNDPPGMKYAETVVELLGQLRPRPLVTIVELPGLPNKGDAVEWVESLGDTIEPDVMRAELQRIVTERGESAQPLTPEHESTDYQRFPVEHLPPVVRSIVSNAAEAFCVDPSFVALPLLTVFAAAIGNTRRLLLRDGWEAPPILWTVIVAESGSVKSPPLDFAKRPLVEQEHQAFQRFQAAMQNYERERLLHERQLQDFRHGKLDEPPLPPTKPVCERFVVDDVTVEAVTLMHAAQPRGLLLARDELAGWFGSMDRYSQSKGGDAPKWLEMFAGRAIRFDRKTGEPQTVRVPMAAVSITGSIQPATLRSKLTRANRENGMASRFLFAFPPRRRKVWNEQGISLIDQSTLALIVEQLLQLDFAQSEPDEPRPQLVQLSPEAKALWVEHVDRHGREQFELSGDLAAAWSKLEETPARLALVLHCVRAAIDDATLGDPFRVDAISMAAGLALGEWFKREARRIYAMLDERPAETERRRLLEWIVGRGGRVTPRHVQQGHRAKNIDEAKAMLQDLVNQGYGTWEPTPPGQRGQPTRYFVAASFNGNADQR